MREKKAHRLLDIGFENGADIDRENKLLAVMSDGNGNPGDCAFSALSLYDIRQTSSGLGEKKQIFSENIYGRFGADVFFNSTSTQIAVNYYSSNAVSVYDVNRGSGFTLRRHFDDSDKHTSLGEMTSVAWHPASHTETIFFPSDAPVERSITTRASYIKRNLRILAMDIEKDDPVADFSQFTEASLSLATFAHHPLMAVMNGLCKGSVVLMAQPDEREKYFKYYNLVV